ncbi:GNAT family N-acetyltransferase [Actinoplanes sp. NPDC051411]|uniref:GNAT family N-acetyltransferase n=1 Tax=Actinoplanes sp. NPDC051411 TaxID=3155522 RepID=UPI0034370F48
MIAGWEWDESLFAGAARHYARGRLPYTPGFPAALAGALAPDGRGRLLDAGCGPGTVTAPLASLEALVRLRMANARAHVALDPAAYRVPDSAAVRRHFSDAATRDGILVAELGRQVAGMVEIVPNPLPPEHQILRPRPSAQIHTVVADDARGNGIGGVLVEAAVRWAAGRGIARLSAGIHHANEGAVRFYEQHGFTGSGVSLTLTL